MFATISVPTAVSGRQVFNPEEIVRLEASSNYTRIYFTNKSKMVCAKVLKDFVPVLEPFGFLRTHRAHLVNKRHIARVTHTGSIIMNDESVAEISRRMKTGVMRALRNAS